MSGNVDEWVWDAYGGYPAQPAKDFRGAGYSVNLDRMLRGGMYNEYEYYLQVGLRDYNKPWGESFNDGFRVARKAG
jgi:formylglycine-generating enzyme